LQPYLHVDDSSPTLVIRQQSFLEHRASIISGAMLRCSAD
jgi:hypothetical protein